MPWSTPTLRKVREMVRDFVTASLEGAAFIGNNVLRVTSDAMAGLAHLVLRYIDWLSLQLLPDTAEREWLDRHGDIWLVNADGTTGRKMATLSAGTAAATLVEGFTSAVIPSGSQLTAPGNLVAYETLSEVLLLADAETTFPIRALDPGIIGNLEEDTQISFVVTPVGVNTAARVVNLTGGTDEEGDTELRIRVLERIRQPPMGGAQYDYVRWAKAVPGVTRAWCTPLEMGIGTVTVRFLMDDLRADDDGWPTYGDVQTVRDYIDTVRPVAVKDFFVEAPIKQRIDAVISQLSPDTPDVRAAIEVSLRQMLRVLAAPGQTIYAAWKSYAIMNAPGVVSFD